MELTNSFSVPMGIDATWKTLLDIERVAPCMPGATLASYDGEALTGSVKVKLGPVQMTYAGSARILERDDEAYVAVIDASGRESRGTGTASVKARAVLVAESQTSTRVEVVTDLTITGKAAQYGRGVMQDVASRIIDQFADNLAALMSGPAEGAGSKAAPEPEEHLEAEALDLVGVAGIPVLKRLAPVLAAVAALVTWLAIRRRRRHR